MTQNKASFKSLEEFWPVYLTQHKLKMTRRLHIFGVMLSLATILWVILTLHLFYIIFVPLFLITFPLIAHVFIEGNSPLFFDNYFLTLQADLHLTLLWINGNLEAELQEHNITT